MQCLVRANFQADMTGPIDMAPNAFAAASAIPFSTPINDYLLLREVLRLKNLGHFRKGYNMVSKELSLQVRLACATGGNTVCQTQSLHWQLLGGGEQ
jgi:hypothetical protein